MVFAGVLLKIGFVFSGFRLGMEASSMLQGK